MLYAIASTFIMFVISVLAAIFYGSLKSFLLFLSISIPFIEGVFFPAHRRSKKKQQEETSFRVWKSHKKIQPLKHFEHNFYADFFLLPHSKQASKQAASRNPHN